MTFVDVKGPRSSRLSLRQKTSGTINGTYSATITFIRGDLYKTRIINRTFTITLGGSTNRIDISGMEFNCDALTGEII
jgi:hypothetical protein